MIKYFLLAGALMLAPELAEASQSKDLDALHNNKTQTKTSEYNSLEDSQISHTPNAEDEESASGSEDEVVSENLVLNKKAADVKRTGYQSETFENENVSRFQSFVCNVKAGFWSLLAKVTKLLDF